MPNEIAKPKPPALEGEVLLPGERAVVFETGGKGAKTYVWPTPPIATFTADGKPTVRVDLSATRFTIDTKGGSFLREALDKQRGPIRNALKKALRAAVADAERVIRGQAPLKNVTPKKGKP